MPLQLIHGPPNSGRTEKVRADYLDLIDRNPLLIVPGVDDIFDWERRLSRESGAMVGGRISHFKDLADEILRKAGVELLPLAGELQRRRFAAQAIASSRPDLASRLRHQPGLITAALDLIDDFRSNLRDPETLERKIGDSESNHLRPIVGLYRDYLSRLESSGHSDRPGRQYRATKADLSGWAGTPVFVAGFDDLTAQQFELLVRLAERTDVTVVITHEPGNNAMALTASLFLALTDAGAKVVLETARPDEPTAHARDLFEAEKRFMRPELDQKLGPGGAIRLMQSSGRRNEAEAVAAEIARLVDRGVPPGEVAIAIDDPSAEGPLFRDVLTSYGIPVTLESETAAASTATGQSVLALLAATGPTGSGSDLLRLLRGPAGPAPEEVDRLERLILRGGIDSAENGMRILVERGLDPPAGWEELVEAGSDGKSIVRILGPLALDIGSQILDRDRDPVPSGATLTETRAATAISRACEELTAIAGEGLGRDAVAEAIGSDAVKVWAVPVAGTTRIASPYSLRAKRVGHLFYASLQEGGIIDSDRSGPFLTSADRDCLALPDYSDPELQARYLFYSMMTVPTDGLWLSCRIADETGKAEYPSPLIGAVEELFEGSWINPEGVRLGRSGSNLTFSPAAAPSLDEFARSVAAGPAESEDRAMAELDPELAVEVGQRVERGRETESRTRRLASLESATVLEGIAAGGRFSATGIEAYAGCPYRWFIERQLRPLPLGPDPEYFAFGNLLHESVAALYRARPGKLPRPDDLEVWLAEVAPEVDRQAAGLGLDSTSPQHRGQRSRARSLISGYLAREAARENPQFLPSHLEVAFGLDETTPPVPMDGWQLVGKVDRIDRSLDGESGLVIDYKTGAGSTLPLAEIRRRRKLQLQLYMHAIRQTDAIRLRPVAGLYMPMGASDPRPRGIFDPEETGRISDLGLVETDGSEDFDRELEIAIELAERSVGEILEGILEHDPASCPDHYDHPAVPDRPSADLDTGAIGPVR